MLCKLCQEGVAHYVFLHLLPVGTERFRPRAAEARCDRGRLCQTDFLFVFCAGELLGLEVMFGGGPDLSFEFHAMRREVGELAVCVAFAVEMNWLGHWENGSR